MRPPRSLPRYQAGISYVEVLAAVIIVAVTVGPATNALRHSMHTAESDLRATVNHYRLLGKMDEVLAKPFAVLSPQAAGSAVPSAYSDVTASIDRRLVFISLYDGDNADADDDPTTGTDPGLLLVRVEVENAVDAVESLKTAQ